MPFAAIALTVLLAVLGQAAWLDGKIERLGTKLGDEIARLDGKIERLDTKLTGEIKRMEDRLDAKIETLQEGQAAIRERLAGVESRVDALSTQPSKPVS